MGTHGPYQLPAPLGDNGQSCRRDDLLVSGERTQADQAARPAYRVPWMPEEDAGAGRRRRWLMADLQPCRSDPRAQRMGGGAFGFSCRLLCRTRASVAPPSMRLALAHRPCGLRREVNPAGHRRCWSMARRMAPIAPQSDVSQTVERRRPSNCHPAFHRGADPPGRSPQLG